MSNKDYLADCIVDVALTNDKVLSQLGASKTQRISHLLSAMKRIISLPGEIDDDEAQRIYNTI